MDRETSIRICRLVSSLIVSDGELHPEEARLADRLADCFELSDADHEAIATSLVDPDAATLEFQALPRDVQEHTFEILLEASLVDGAVADSERAYLVRIGAAMGLRPEFVQARIVERGRRRPSSASS